jgi:putative tryptophan/tyrosine transport system substrate-binding protein
MHKMTIAFITSMSITILAVLFGIYEHYHCRMITQPAAFSATKIAKKHHDKIFKIAIFEPALHPAIEEISQSFRATLDNQGTHPYEFNVYNANGNKTLQRAQAEEIINQNYDLIFIIGASCTKLIKELTTKKQLDTPVVFCAVDDPVGMGIISSLQDSQNHLTGVIESPDYQRQLAILTTLKPATRTIVLVYDPTHGTGLEKDRQQITALAATYGITVQAIPIYNAGELQQKIESQLAAVDVALVLKDNTVVAAIDGLIRLCNRYGVTLYVSDLNSGEKGASLAYGVYEKEYGIASAAKVLLILEKSQAPHSIPTTALHAYVVAINEKTAVQQKLVIEPTMTFLLQSTRFIAKSPHEEPRSVTP